VEDKKIIDPFDSEPKFEKKRTPFEKKSGVVDPFDFNPRLTMSTPQERNQDIENNPKPREVLGIPDSPDRETRATKELPEIQNSGVLAGGGAAKSMKIAALITASPNPEDIAKILESNYPEIGITRDPKGNLIANNNKTGAQGVINKPDLSGIDIVQGLGLMAAFTPAGRAGALATTTGGKVAAVGAASGATELGIDLARQAGGSKENVSLANVDPVTLAAATVGGGVFEGAGIKLMNIARKVKAKGLTEEIKQEFKAQLESNGINPKEITDDFMVRYFNAANEAVDQVPAQAKTATDEFDIPFTKGQATQNTKQLNLEDSLREGRLGSKAQEKMQDFQGKQVAAINKTAATEQANLSGGRATIETPNDAGGLVGEGIRAKERIASQGINDAFAEVGQASLTSKGVKGLNTRLIRRSKVEQFDIGEGFEQTTKTLNELKEFDKFVKEGNQVRPLQIKQIERFRKRIGNRIGAAGNPSDKRQMTILKKELDNYLDSSVDRHLFNGDEGALDQLKTARGLRAKYAQQFQRIDKSGKRSIRKFKDDAGDVMERIINTDPTDTEVINYMFGASKFASKQSGGKIATKVKQVLGEDSIEWKSLREAAFMRLAKPAKDGKISGRLFSSRLGDALENPSLMRTLFTDKEIGRMKFFASAIKRAQPDKVNPSGTSNAIAQTLQQVWEGLATSIGFTSGGPIGAIAARQGVKAGSGFRAIRKANKALEGEKVFTRHRLGAAGAAGAVQSSQTVADDR